VGIERSNLCVSIAFVFKRFDLGFVVEHCLPSFDLGIDAVTTG
jgi:hypothetical protein